MASGYQRLKLLLKKWLPDRFLRQLEPTLRIWYARLFYYGQQKECTVCNSQLRSFISLPSGDLLCPACGSLGRQRRLWHLLRTDYPLKGKVLHFSPARPLYSRLIKHPNIEYTPSDFEGEFPSAKQYDITKIPESDQHFDTIICYHVLEHIPADSIAMKELFRVLKPGGKVLIQTPFKGGVIYENAAIKTPEERLQHFGQEDHVRVYSVAGLQQRLEEAGFHVQVRRFEDSPTNQRLGLKAGEQILIASRKD